jgi:hypothetical protein
MKFGVREIANVVFKAKADTTIGTSTFKAGQPVLYIDSATTSTIEGAATTVYAQGGRGNTRLIAWEGEKTLTFTVEDALLSPIGFSILSGAGLFKDENTDVHVHVTSQAYVSDTGVIDLTDALGATEEIDATADDADADDLYKAVRVAILSTSVENSVESYAVDGGCLALADGSDTLVDDTVASRNTKYPATQGANSILDSDNYSATGTDNKSGITGLIGRMTDPDGKVYGMSAATPTLTEITQNKGATSVATLTGTSTAGEFGTPVKLIVRVWLEGEDGNCWNENAGQDWQICLKFTKDALAES